MFFNRVLCKLHSYVLALLHPTEAIVVREGADTLLVSVVFTCACSIPLSTTTLAIGMQQTFALGHLLGVEVEIEVRVFHLLLVLHLALCCLQLLSLGSS